VLLDRSCFEACTQQDLSDLEAVSEMSAFIPVVCVQGG
jgi:hypothetical protein